MIDKDYLKKIKERSKESHVHRKFQFIGLEIATLLNDQKHKALYIKMAKERNPETLLAIAKDVSMRKNIENKGGYFMKVVQSKLPKINKLTIEQKIKKQRAKNVKALKQKPQG